MGVVELKLVTSYENLVEQGCQLVDKQQNMNWDIGELATKVVKDYGEDKLQQYADDIGKSCNRLQQLRWAVECWPQKIGRPYFWTAYVLGTHPDRYKIVADNPKITKREAIELMRERRKLVPEPQPEPAPEPIHPLCPMPDMSPLPPVDEEIKKLHGLLSHYAYLAREYSLADCGGNHYDCNILKGNVSQELIDAIQEVIDVWTKLRNHLRLLK